MRRAIAVVGALVLFGACGGDNPKLAKPKTTTTDALTGRGADDDAGANTTARFKPSQPGNAVTTEYNPVDAEAYTDGGDYDNGRHAGMVKSFDADRVGVDVVQFLTGDEAKEAYAEDTGNTDGPDNDYYVRNQSKTVRNLPVDRHVVIRVNNTGGYPPSDPNDGHEVSVDTFQTYFDNGTAANAIFWFTIKDGLVVSIEEQYVP
jgi:hypothetical protein